MKLFTGIRNVTCPVTTILIGWYSILIGSMPFNPISNGKQN